MKKNSFEDPRPDRVHIGKVPEINLKGVYRSLRTSAKEDSMIPRQNLPAWWPTMPYPEEIFPMTLDEYKRAFPDANFRTAISGALMRMGWEVASEMIYNSALDHIESLIVGFIYTNEDLLQLVAKKAHRKENPKVVIEQFIADNKRILEALRKKAYRAERDRHHGRD